MRHVYLIAGIASLVTTASLPYSYYEVLRLVLSVAAIGLAVQSVKTKNYGWLALAVPVFALWFPAFGVTMEKSSWLTYNLVAGVAFIAASRSKALRA